jgi:Fe-S cluster biogenesis protein NfuA
MSTAETSENTGILQDEALYGRIEQALIQIRPYLEADGGNVSLADVTQDMIVRVRLHGACSSCKMSMMTLKAGVEQSIIRAVPEIKGVEAIED